MESPAPDHSTSSISVDTALGLSFDYLKHLGTIAMTAVGGLIALVQFVDADKKFFFKIMIATSMMFLAALLAFLAQFSLVDRVRQPHEMLRRRERMDYTHDNAKKVEKIFEGLALWLLSIGTGIALQALFVVGMPG